MADVIFDSNVFDDLVNGIMDISILESKEINVFITHIQVDELNECPDKEKKVRLFGFLTEIRPEKIPTESFVIGTSRIGSAKISDGNLIEKLRGDNYKKTNDALIGETAIKNRLTLITNDIRFRNKVNELGGKAITVEELLNN